MWHFLMQNQITYIISSTCGRTTLILHRPNIWSKESKLVEDKFQPNPLKSK